MWRETSGPRSAAVCLVALTAFLLGACNMGQVVRAPDEWARDFVQTAKWRNAKRSAPNEVEIITIEHAVAFPGSDEGVSPVERQTLLDFLRHTGLQSSDRVTLHGPLRDFGRHDPVTAKRLETLKAELDAVGIPNEIVEDGRIAPNDPDRIAVLITRAVAITPDCGQTQPARGHRPKWAMGCSNTANLGLMVADPLDLKEGRTMGPADGEFGALRIQRYREGEVQEFETDDTATT